MTVLIKAILLIALLWIYILTDIEYIDYWLEINKKSAMQIPILKYTIIILVSLFSLLFLYFTYLRQIFED